MESQEARLKLDLAKALVFFIVIMFAATMASGYRVIFKDMILRSNNESYFEDDKTEDLVVELFTKQGVKRNSNTKEEKRIIFSTSRYLSEKDLNKTVDHVLNYVSNVGGTINNIATEKFSNGGLIVFRPREIAVKTIDIEVPKDAPFAESLEDTLLKFIYNEKYTTERYNKRHNVKNIVNN